jgi:class 3 adenylate cyclase/tetratricopeptide (TPR) repeat protein
MEMLTCPSCGAENPDRAKFCMECAAPLGAPIPHPEERKVVTTLFCDLVGSTALGEDADPEDVDAMLRRYNGLARQVVESHGGVVEKFIGDAVVAVFGVPTTHEDDPERAVRAGLRMVAAVTDLPPVAGHPIQVRVGINTGEALVRLDVTPGSGEGFLTGDAVNVGARLQSAAPSMGVVVGEATHALTEKAIVYEELAPVVAKGKREALKVWLAKAPVARTGAARAPETAPFVGREAELARLEELFNEVVASGRSRLALVSGEPGVGKSRLVAELFAYIDHLPALVTWRQGRCVPYGEDASFWALGEIVKAQAGVMDTDDKRRAEEKLENVLPAGGDHAWLAERLRPLLGLEASQASREENFTAWAKFLEHLARGGPAVLVFEDLHWADDGMLAFVEHLSEKVTGVPLFVLATTRPQLLERRASYLEDHALRLDLMPLSDGETERLLAQTLKADALAPEVSASMLARCAGNPLYTLEFAALLRERGLLAGASDGLQLAENADLPLPGSVQAVIAARLDGLPVQDKAVLADAAVIGQTFWSGAVDALGEDGGRAAVQPALARLAESGLVTQAATSTMAEEREFSFAHILVRDVAYGQLPRRARAAKHAAFAGWLEAKVGERASDVVDVLAHHYATALDLARSAGDESFVAGILGPALGAFALAGEKAMELNVASAERHFSRALEWSDTDDPQRAWWLAKWAMAVDEQARFGESQPALEEAIPQLIAAGERRKAAQALIYLGASQQAQGQADADARMQEAVDLLDGDDPSLDMVFVLFNASLTEGNSGRTERALLLAERATAAAAELGLSAEAGDEGTSHYIGALMARGAARCQLGDPEGLEDERRGHEIALGHGWGSLSGANLGNSVYQIQGPPRAIPLYESVIERTRNRGVRYLELSVRAGLISVLADAGRWDEALTGFDDLVTELVDVQTVIDVKVAIGIIHVRRGDVTKSKPLLASALNQAETMQMPASLAAAMIGEAAGALQALDGARAGRLLSMLESTLDRSVALYDVYLLPEMLRTARGADLALEERLTTWVPTGLPTQACVRMYGEALLAEARGAHEEAAAGFADAAARWREFGVPYEEAQALLGRGRCLVALGTAQEAAPVLEQAREIFERLKAKPAVEEAGALLARSAAG